MYALILRRLKLNNENYYQMIDKVEAEEISKQVIRVTKGYHNFEGQDIVSIDDSEREVVYAEIDDTFNQIIDGEGTAFFKHDSDGEVIPIEDIVERNNIILAFYNKYKDFHLIPDYDLDEEITKLEANMKKSVLGQDEVIKKMISKIYNNQMYFKSDLDYNIVCRNKSNILVVGTIGSGKTTIKDAMLETDMALPIVEVELSENYLEVAGTIVNALISAANGNMYLAQRGIVIFDGINYGTSKFSKDEDGELEDNLTLKALEKIVKSKKIYFPTKDGDSVFAFDFSLITFVAMVDTYYEETGEVEEPYYEKMPIEAYNDLGLTDTLLIEGFSNEIIYMNEMTKELALKILNDKNLSPLYQYKKLMEENGKVVKVSKNFVDKLIEYGLNTDEGFEGIKRFFRYAVECKDRSSNPIIFKVSDLSNLRIGSAGFGEYSETAGIFPLNDTQTKKTLKDDILDVNVKKRTINGLHVRDVVKIITKEYKGQDEHAFRIVNAFYNHVLNRYKGFSEDEYKKLKQNVFLIASTGVGKTGIFESLAKIFNLPYKRDSINSYTASGYVGRSVDDLITGLIASAHDDVSKAQFGILCLDEFDKLARDNEERGAGFGKKVQEELLTLIEGDERDIQEDIYGNTFKFNTEYLFIVLTGACQDIDKIIKDRIKSSRSLGFSSETETKISREVTSEDLLKYGFEQQLLARVPNIIRLNDLSKDVLLEIIKSEMGYISLIRKSYQMSGVRINLTENFMNNLAIASFNAKIGARGIRQIFEDRIIPHIDERVVDGNILEITIGDNALLDPNDITYIERRVKKKVKRR